MEPLNAEADTVEPELKILTVQDVFEVGVIEIVVGKPEVDVVNVVLEVCDIVITPLVPVAIALTL